MWKLFRLGNASCMLIQHILMKNAKTLFHDGKEYWKLICSRCLNSILFQKRPTTITILQKVQLHVTLIKIFWMALSINFYSAETHDHCLLSKTTCSMHVITSTHSSRVIKTSYSDLHTCRTFLSYESRWTVTNKINQKVLASSMVFTWLGKTLVNVCKTCYVSVKILQRKITVLLR